MFTFSTPCLRFKLLLAFKGQYGWPGFEAPHAIRYLNKLVVITTTPTFDYGTASQAPSNVATQLWVLDRITGAVISPAPGAALADADFPYGLPLNQDANETWSVSETHFNHVLNNGYFVIETDVTLSHPYTLGQVDADTDTLLSSVSVASRPWNTIQVVAYDEVSVPIGPYTPGGDLTQLLPPQVVYQNVFDGSIVAVPNLQAAAWYIYAPGEVTAVNWFPNGYSKLIGYVAMAGNYCKKTYTIDYAQKLLNQTCESGAGSCASPFKVTPPAPVAGQNAYVLVVPNCQCGG